MKRIGWLAMATLAVAALAWWGGQMTATAEGEAEHGYLGVQECKVCHKAKAKGEQFQKWEASAHSQAYASLLTDESKEIAANMGLKDAPEKADACLKCHVTGHGAKAELLGKKYTVEEGVGCESCHGPGSEYKKVHIKDVETAMTLGMMIPTDESMCKTCHNEESPTYKEFKYEEALAQIAHPNPKKAEEE